jgi:hypothetical protein
MPDPTLLGDLIQPAWNSLTPEQRTCWHFFAAANPKLTANGALHTLYGQQLHYKTNAWIAVADGPALLTDPPPTPTPPPPVEIQSAAWPLQSYTSGGATARNGFAYITVPFPTPAQLAVIIRQGYIRKLSGNSKPTRIRHVTIILPLDSGDFNLTDPRGYFATTGGRRKFSVITGRNAKRRPDKPLGTAILINVDTGEKQTATINNPFGGSRTKSNRPRATSVSPTSGVNHYP